MFISLLVILYLRHAKWLFSGGSEVRGHSLHKLTAQVSAEPAQEAAADCV